MENYVHGYTEKESCRLADQAKTLAELLNHDTRYPAGSRILEAGCGIGAQTVILTKNSPDAHFHAIDISQDSIDHAQKAVMAENITNVTFQGADIFDLPFQEGDFDHIFVCFVLEHLSKPLDALMYLNKVLKKGGTITVIEGDHGSFYCYPESKEAMQTVRCLIDIQAGLKGNSLIGRQLYPLINQAGFRAASVSPRMVYVDSSKPDLVDGFSKKTFIAMVEGVKEQALSLNMINEKIWNKGIKDLYRATEDDGTFCYTFFKGTAFKP
ncbi:MAG: SAM-dependent methyltransferase [Syntrophus sp. (in: bacteria)]|nr:SAM-dependent methyltransferase [Syntrophus sp. (in: bacteria)]